MKTKLFKHFK